jgi:hypothetical protein
LFLSTTIVADVLVTVEEITPSTLESADCTFGGHPIAHLRPVSASTTVSTFALATVTAGLAGTAFGTTVADSAHDIIVTAEATTAEAIVRLRLIDFFMI